MFERFVALPDAISIEIPIHTRNRLPLGCQPIGRHAHPAMIGRVRPQTERQIEAACKRAIASGFNRACKRQFFETADIAQTDPRALERAIIADLGPPIAPIAIVAATGRPFGNQRRVVEA